VVEFISEHTEKQELDEPPPSIDEQSHQKPLEELVEEHLEEIQPSQADQTYIDEPSNASGEYHQPENQELKLTTELKHELKPLVYDDNEQIIVVDIFEKYSKNEPSDDKWWKKNTKY
jgi:hypothetical protein